MNIENKDSHSKASLISLSILLVVFAYMYALNFFMPLHRDDYEYSLIWGTLDKITSMADVFTSLHIHYFAHGGRMVDFFVLDTFLLIGKEWFNPFNALLFVLLILLIYWHSQQKVTWRLNPYLLVLILVFCWFGLPDFALTNIWMTGACVYLMPAVFILGFLLPYHFNHLNEPMVKDCYPAAIGMFFAGIAASWTIENMAATMNLITAGFVLEGYRQKVLKKWMVAGFSGGILGFLLLVVAPGNYVRYASQNTKLVDHIANQFGAGIAIFLGVLPVVLFLLLCWRILLSHYAKQKGIYVLQSSGKGIAFSWLARFIIMLMLVASYLDDSFFSKWASRVLYQHVAVPIGVANDHLKMQLYKTMSGLEDVTAYLLVITGIYDYIMNKLSLGKNALRNVIKKISYKELIAAYPELRPIITLLVLALINNLIMLASPTFPGRAGYGSVVLLIIAALRVFTIPTVKTYLLTANGKRTVAIIAGLLIIPMAVVVLQQHRILYAENNARLAYVEQQVKEGAVYVEVTPLSVKNMILQHVYFVELNNGVSKYGFCRYYGLKNIVVK